MTFLEFSHIRPMFGGKLTQSQVDGINVITEAWSRFGDGDRRKLAYLLATAKHETANTMQPIMERGARSYFDKYEPSTRIGKALGNAEKGDGYKFRGAGYVQLTGRANFVKAGRKIGRNLVNAPGDALIPEVAAEILIKGCMEGWFAGKGLPDYINDKGANFIEARRVVNGTDRASLIAGYADKFLAALSEAPQSPVQPQDPPAAPTIPVEPPLPPTPQPTGFHVPWWVWVLVALALIAAAFVIPR